MAPTESSSSVEVRPQNRNSQAEGGSQAANQPRVRSSYTVFLSHSTKDSWLADIIAAGIQKRGGRVWLDINQLNGGDMIYGEIIAAVDSCDEAIVILSPNSIDSKWVLFEMGAICGQHKRLTPILVYVEPSAIPVVPGMRAIEINQIEHVFLPELERRITEKDSKQ